MPPLPGGGPGAQLLRCFCSTPDFSGAARDPRTTPHSRGQFRSHPGPHGAPVGPVTAVGRGRPGRSDGTQSWEGQTPKPLFPQKDPQPLPLRGRRDVPCTPVPGEAGRPHVEAPGHHGPWHRHSAQTAVPPSRLCPCVLEGSSLGGARPGSQRDDPSGTRTGQGSTQDQPSPRCHREASKRTEATPGKATRLGPRSPPRSSAGRPPVLVPGQATESTPARGPHSALPGDGHRDSLVSLTAEGPARGPTQAVSSASAPGSGTLVHSPHACPLPRVPWVTVPVVPVALRVCHLPSPPRGGERPQGPAVP